MPADNIFLEPIGDQVVVSQEVINGGGVTPPSVYLREDDSRILREDNGFIVREG